MGIALRSSSGVGGSREAGLTIALVHLLFNLTGTLLIFPVEALRNVPLRLARWLADLAVRSRVLAVAYVVVLFYLVPAAFAILNRALG